MGVTSERTVRYLTPSAKLNIYFMITDFIKELLQGSDLHLLESINMIELTLCVNYVSSIFFSSIQKIFQAN